MLRELQVLYQSPCRHYHAATYSCKACCPLLLIPSICVVRLKPKFRDQLLKVSHAAGKL